MIRLNCKLRENAKAEVEKLKMRRKDTHVVDLYISLISNGRYIAARFSARNSSWSGQIPNCQPF